VLVTLARLTHALETGGFAGLCTQLTAMLPSEAGPLLDGLRLDEAFLARHPRELAARLWACALACEATAAVEPLVRDADRPWLRALRRRPHGENPVCLTDALRSSGDATLLLINGSRAELWSLVDDRRLWSTTQYLARDLEFTADGRHLIGHDVDRGGMTDYNPYTLVLDAHTGAQVYYTDNYRSVGSMPSNTALCEPRNHRLSSKARFDAQTMAQLDVEVLLDGQIVAMLPSRTRACISTPNALIALEPGYYVCYELVEA
jgi:hypothetical protein